MPYGTINKYKTAEGWKDFVNIVEMENTIKKGDLTGDDVVNGTDLVALANIILGKAEQSIAADVNEDGLVNGTDIVALCNIILGRTNAQARSIIPPLTSNEPSLSIEPLDIKAGETKTMTIDLTNPNDEFTLVQFDLTLPAGLSIKTTGGDFDIDMCDRTTWRKHSLEASIVDGAYRFLLYSGSNTLTDGNSGGIITVTLVADDSFAGGTIKIDNTLLVTPDQKETKPAAYEYVIGNPVVTAASLSIEPLDIKAGETKTMTIDLTNPNDEFTLVQFDLTLPAGLGIKTTGGDFDIDMCDRTTWRKHSLEASKVDSAYRFLLYSGSNTLIDGNSGGIITVTLVADDSFAGGTIKIDNTLLVTPDQDETKPAAYEYVIGTTGINGIKGNTERTKEGKYLENGRIVIYHNGKKYDSNGTIVE